MRTRSAVAVGVLALTTCLAGCTSGTDLSAVADTCTKVIDGAMATAGGQYSSGDFLEVDGDGSLSVTSPVKGQLGAAITGVAVGCIMKETAAPASVEARLREGTVLDGQREITWGDLTMSYRFHPDEGLRAVVSLA